MGVNKKARKNRAISAHRQGDHRPLLFLVASTNLKVEFGFAAGGSW